jgi:uncharacterized membrane protein
VSRNQRLLLLILAFVVIVVAVIVLPGSNKSHLTSATQTITVKGGKAIGGVRTIDVKKNAHLRITVRSIDYAGEIHMHGYDVHKDVTPGHAVVYDLRARIDGEFVIELEKTGTQIGELKVEP